MAEDQSPLKPVFRLHHLKCKQGPKGLASAWTGMNQHITVRDAWNAPMQAVGVGNTDQFHFIQSVFNGLEISLHCIQDNSKLLAISVTLFRQSGVEALAAT